MFDLRYVLEKWYKYLYLRFSCTWGVLLERCLTWDMYLRCFTWEGVHLRYVLLVTATWGMMYWRCTCTTWEVVDMRCGVLLGDAWLEICWYVWNLCQISRFKGFYFCDIVSHFSIMARLDAAFEEVSMMGKDMGKRNQKVRLVADPMISVGQLQNTFEQFMRYRKSTDFWSWLHLQHL